MYYEISYYLILIILITIVAIFFGTILTKSIILDMKISRLQIIHEAVQTTYMSVYQTYPSIDHDEKIALIKDKSKSLLEKQKVSISDADLDTYINSNLYNFREETICH